MKANHPYDLLKQWQLRDIAVLLLPFMALLLISIIQSSALSTLAIGSSLLLAVIGTLWLISRSKKSISEIVETVNVQNEKLEHSSSLLLGQEHSTGLQRLQLAKVKDGFAAHNYKYSLPKKALLLTSYWNCALLVLMWCFSYFNLSENSALNTADPSTPFLIKESEQSSQAGSIASIALEVLPPTYTKLPKYFSKDLNIKIPESSTVSWRFKKAGDLENLSLILEDKGHKNLDPALFFKDQFSNSDIYRYQYTADSRDTTSDYYSITVVEDQYPRASISGIEQYNKVAWNSLSPISFSVEAADEYGIEELFILATVAKGSGESVKFREEQFSFDNFRTGIKNFTSTYTFDLQQLQLEPGDELYFHLRVKDNCPFRAQWTKSESIVVNIPDTAAYALSDIAGMSVDLLPDFFRSQRQIIIDSEKLLKHKNEISQDSFKRASNELGFDQKMLRLKYGQFLGEENESGIAIQNDLDEEETGINHDDHQHEDDGSSETLTNARDVLSEFMHDHDNEDHQDTGIPVDEKKAKDRNKPTWVEELSHNHDNIEEATFFDISIKSKLRSAMSEMWDAELHLRLYDPKTSLPFQYASLELLKEIKNHARIYVQRVGFDPPLIKAAEKRLTGDQDEINSPSALVYDIKDDHYQSIRSIVHQLTVCPSEQIHLHIIEAIEVLSEIAIQAPHYLPILTELQGEAGNDNPNRQMIINALVKTLPAAEQQVKRTTYSAHELTLQSISRLQF